MAIGVVVVTYRSLRHVEACLAALPAAAAGREYDLLVVDNASDDGTVGWLREHLPAARVIANPDNRGFATACHQAAARMPGADLLLLNPDAVLEAGALACLADELARDAAVGAVGARLLDMDGSPQPCAWRDPDAAGLAFEALRLHNVFPRSRLHRWEPAGPDPEDVPCLSGACLLVRRACWERVGGLDEGFFLYHEDLDFCRRARAAGYRLRLVPAARARHEVGGSSFQDRRAFRAHFRAGRRRFILKHHPGAYGRGLLLIDGAGRILDRLAALLRGGKARRAS